MGMLKAIKRKIINFGRWIIGEPSVEREVEMVRMRAKAVTRAKELKREKKYKDKPGMWYTEGYQWICDKSPPFPEPGTISAIDYNCRWERRRIAVGHEKPTEAKERFYKRQFEESFGVFGYLKDIKLVRGK